LRSLVTSVHFTMAKTSMMTKGGYARKDLKMKRPYILKLFLAVDKMVASIRSLFPTIWVSPLPVKTRQINVSKEKERIILENESPVHRQKTETEEKKRLKQTVKATERSNSNVEDGTQGHEDTNELGHQCKFSKFSRKAESITEDITPRSDPDLNNNILHFSIRKSTNKNITRNPRTENTAKLHLLVESKLSSLHERRFQLEMEESFNSNLVLFILNNLSEVGTEAEVSKLSLHFTEVETLNCLRLSLTTRLARTESQIECILNLEEKLDLHKKQKRLTEQVYEAWQISLLHKRREKILRTILGKYFDEGFLVLFDTALENKVLNVRRSREVSDMISLMEEQMEIIKHDHLAQ